MALKRNVWIWLGIGLLSLVLAPGMPCAAQEAAEERSNDPKSPITRIVKIEHASLDEIMTVGGLLSDGRVKLHVLGESRAIAVIGSSEEDLARMLDVIRELDVPPPGPKNLEVIVYMLQAIENGEKKPESLLVEENEDDSESTLSSIVATSAIPEEMEAVVEELKKTFGYKSIRHLETIPMRCREGAPCQSRGLYRNVRQDAAVFYSVSFKSASVSGEAGEHTISIDQFEAGAEVPYTTKNHSDGAVHESISWRSVGLYTDLDIREGQKVVVGKARFDGGVNSLFVVVTAKVAP